VLAVEKRSTHLAVLLLAICAAAVSALLTARGLTAQSVAELRLGVERSRLAEQELEDELAVEKRLVKEGLASEVELRRAQSRLERARIDTEMARAKLTGALPPVRLLSATRRNSKSGEPEVHLVFERTGSAAERFGQSAVVSVLSDGLAVGRPFQQVLRFAPGSKPSASLDFDLVRDVAEITVVTLSGTRRDEVRVPLQLDSGGDAVGLSSLNSSQDGQLGDSVDYDVVVERTNADVESVALQVDGLPSGFAAEILDEEKRSRLRLVQFPQGVDRLRVVVRVTVPDQEDAAWSDQTIDLPVRATLPSSGRELASVVLHLRPVGRPELSLVTDQLSIEVAPGSSVMIPVEVVNSGRAAAFDVQPRLSEPIGLEVSADPSKIQSIPPGQKQYLAVRVTPREEAIEGDYQVRVRAVTQQAGSYAESKDLTLRVTVRRRLPWVALGGALSVLIVLSLLAWKLLRRRGSETFEPGRRG